MLHDAAVQCTVKSVNKADGTIVATSVKEEVDYFNVRLKAVLPDGTGAGILAYPVVGSAVSIVLLDGLDTMAFVAQMSEVESWLVKAQNGVSIELTQAGKLLLNGSSLGGLVKVANVLAKVNRLEAAVNTLGTLMSTHVHALVTPTLPPAPFPAAVAVASGQAGPVLTPTLRTDLENTNVQHG